jgi:hypothetical protein
VKCEGIDGRVLAEAAKAKISDFFFLDLSVPAPDRPGVPESMQAASTTSSLS